MSQAQSSVASADQSAIIVELNSNETIEEMQPARNEELAFQETSEQLQPAQDDELAQDDDTKGTKTIGDGLAESNGIADKDEVKKKIARNPLIPRLAGSNGIADTDEVDKKKSTQSTDSQELNFVGTSEKMQPAQNEELAQTFVTKGAETIGDKLAESNGISDNDEVENMKSTQSTDCEIYVPINIKDFYWYLAVINTGVRRIQVIDSLGPGMNLKDLIAMDLHRKLDFTEE
ncbi:hypothetical protein D1007_20053 [Hordeum vulgare]|nr:hypothetical protein D1007_20053 [Hordeum vulgare]